MPVIDNSRKTAMLSVKLAPERLEHFRIASALRGTTMSALVSQFITQIVREEMEAVPDAFKRSQSKRAADSDLTDRQHELN